jgi:hypothetical protein
LIAISRAVDPNAPIAILFKQIEDCQKYATAGGSPFTPQQIIQAAEALILKTGRYPQAFREWKNLDAVNQTYVTFKDRFYKEFQLQNSLNISAQNAGYQAHNAYGVPPDTDMEDANLASAAQDFAAAESARQSAMAQLTSTNGNLTSTNENLNNQLANMAMQNQQMQQQMQQMQYYANFAAPQQPPSRGGRGRGGRGRYRGGRNNYQQPPTQGYNNYPTAGPPASNAPQAPPWQRGPPATPWQPPQQAPTAPAWQTPPATTWQPPTPTPNWQSPQQGPPAAPWQQPQQPNWQQPRNVQPAHPNAKKYNNTNYCWSHGADISDAHTGWSCRRMANGHQQQATRQSTMGGNPKDLHKVWMGPPT